MKLTANNKPIVFSKCLELLCHVLGPLGNDFTIMQNSSINRPLALLMIPKLLPVFAIFDVNIKPKWFSNKIKIKIDLIGFAVPDPNSAYQYWLSKTIAPVLVWNSVYSLQENNPDKELIPFIKALPVSTISARDLF